MSETLKYFYLVFSLPDLISLDKNLLKHRDTHRCSKNERRSPFQLITRHYAAGYVRVLGRGCQWVCRALMSVSYRATRRLLTQGTPFHPARHEQAKQQYLREL